MFGRWRLLRPFCCPVLSGLVTGIAALALALAGPGPAAAAPAGGMEPQERCSVVRDRLLDALAGSERLEPRPGVVAGQPVVTVGSGVLVTVMPETARLNETVPSLLAWRWTNNLREALDLPP